MCIAIYKQPEQIVTKEILEICAENNPDGCGFTYVNDKGVVKLHNHMKFEDHWPVLKKALKDFPNSPFLIHYRVTTHGGTNLFNCHPFWVHEGEMAMMHNGTISKCIPSRTDKDENRNDTQIFNDTVLKNLPKNFHLHEGMTPLIEEYIGRSKVLVLDKDQNVTIYNEDLGNWDKGIWYSNLSWNRNTKSTASTVWTPPKNNVKQLPNKSTAAAGKFGKYSNMGHADGSWKVVNYKPKFSRKQFKIINAVKHVLDETAGFYRQCDLYGTPLNTLEKDIEIVDKHLGKSKKKDVVMGECTWCQEAHKLSKLIHIRFDTDNAEEFADDIICESCAEFLQEDYSYTGWIAIVESDDEVKQQIIDINHELAKTKAL